MENGISVRLTREEDIPAVLAIYDSARAFMASRGNPTQWIGGYPSEDILREDIAAGDSRVIEKGGVICGTFALCGGEEETYRFITDGTWLNDLPYITIHRIAGNGTLHGLTRIAVRCAEEILPNIRIDTHARNLPMQHAVERLGFQKCGTIYVEDGTPRIAYQRLSEEGDRI